MNKEFDVVVVGSGPAGLTVAARCRRANRRVAIVERGPPGGTCAQRGCTPKKVLVSVASTFDSARRLEGLGLELREASMDWSALQAFKRTFTDPVPKRTRDKLAKRDIRLIEGEATFVDSSTLAAGGQELRAEHFVIATGARPRPLGFPGADRLATSDDFLELDDLPQRVAFIGAGFITFELAGVAVRAGAEVTIVHRGDRALKGFDHDLVRRLVRRTKESGARVLFERSVDRLESGSDGFRLCVRDAHGAETDPVEADLVVHGAGRVPAIDGLDLEAADVEADPSGVVVDSHQRSISNDRVWAVGDAAASGRKQTPSAEHEARACAENIVHGDVAVVRQDLIPSVCFSIPPLASIGLTESDCSDRGLDVDVVSADSSSWFSARQRGEPAAGHKVLVERGSGRIVGAHLLGPEADELINLFAVAMQAGVTADALETMHFAFPTTSSGIPSMV